MSEWVEFVEAWIESQQLPCGQHSQAARVLLDDCVEHDELTIYEAHCVHSKYVDECTGFS